jgi:hypothetical protein
MLVGCGIGNFLMRGIDRSAFVPGDPPHLSDNTLLDNEASKGFRSSKSEQS